MLRTVALHAASAAVINGHTASLCTRMVAVHGLRVARASVLGCQRGNNFQSQPLSMTPQLATAPVHSWKPTHMYVEHLVSIRISWLHTVGL
jgi:hypothetical protein